MLRIRKEPDKDPRRWNTLCIKKTIRSQDRRKKIVNVIINAIITAAKILRLTV